MDLTIATPGALKLELSPLLVGLFGRVVVVFRVALVGSMLLPKTPTMWAPACGLNLSLPKRVLTRVILIELNARLLTLILRLMLCISVPIPWPSPIRLTPVCNVLFPPLAILLVRL